MLRSKADPTILNQALSNLSINPKKANRLSAQETKDVAKELKTIIYAEGSLPNFIGDEKESTHTDAIEPDDYRRKWLNNIFYLDDIVRNMILTHENLHHNHEIAAQAKKNIGFKQNDQKSLTDEDIHRFKEAVKIILTHRGIPFKTAPVEKKSASTARKVARNFARHILRGVIVNSGIKGEPYKDGLAMIEDAVDNERRPELLTALREEIQVIFHNAIDWIIDEEKKSPDNFADNEKTFGIFVHGLLALYPFLDPVPGEIVILPQKINHHWIPVTYQFNRIDISPKTGFLSSLIEDQDRIYAYGLIPTPGQDPAIQSHLLLMGTTCPTGQGAKFAALENFRPGYSVGESHDTTDLDAWVQSQTSVAVSGQSKGAVMAMITAARHPNKISTAHCLNPTALNRKTLERLQPAWDALRDAKKPTINVYAQAGDPVFPLENGFLNGTNIFRIFPNHKDVSNYKPLLPQRIQRAAEAHIHNFCGRSSTLILRGNLQKYNNSRWREFRGDVKEAINYVLYPLMYVDFWASLRTRKFQKDHPNSKLIIKPFAFLGNIISTILKVGLLIPTLIVATAFSGLVKTPFRMLFNIRSDYQKAPPAPPASIRPVLQGGSPALALANQGVSIISSVRPNSAITIVATPPVSGEYKALVSERDFDPTQTQTASLSLRS